MRDYEIRADYTDETYDVSTVPADSIGEALAIVRRDPEVVSATVLCTIDRAPAACLAF